MSTPNPPTSAGWSIKDGVATYNGGENVPALVCGKEAYKYWTFRATVKVHPDVGLSVVVENDEYTGGMAHGGAYTSITIPGFVLQALLGT